MAIAETISSNWRSLVAITASVSVAGMGFGFSYPVITLTMERWGTPEVIIGLNAGMFALSALLFSPLVPRLLSRFGAVTFLIACIVDIVICLLLFKAVNNIVLWFPLRFLAGCGINGLFVATDVWISQLANDANRGRIIAIYSTCLTAGFVIGPMLLLVTGTDGWLPFLSGAGLVALATIPILFVIGREPKFEQTTVAATFQYLKLAPTLVSAGLMFGLLEASMFGFFPIFGMRLGLTEDQAPLMVIALAAGNLCCQMPIGWLADRMNKQLLLAIGAALSLILALLLPAAGNNLPLVFVIVFFWGGIVVGLYTVSIAALGDRYRGAALASANAALGMLYGLGALAGPAVSGLAMQNWQPYGLIWALAIFSAGYMVFAFLRWHSGGGDRPDGPRT